MPIYQVNYYVQKNRGELRTEADCEASAIVKAQESLDAAGIEGRWFTATDVTEATGQLVMDVTRSVIEERSK